MISKQRKSERRERVDAVMLMKNQTHDQSDISALLEPYRNELHLHCYRLLGSLHDAEDMVQETMLRAWRHIDSFRGTSSLRTWLYTIATNTCLDALKKRSPRTLPTSTSPARDPLTPPTPLQAEHLWLEPFPDTWLLEAAENPEARYARQESVSLAFLLALQLLPPRQRAILILSDVLDWHANEIADLLAISVSAVNSALHRARVTLQKNYHSDQQEKTLMKHVDTEINTLLSHYVHAWETDDVAGLVALLKDDAILSMPPVPSWYQGRETIQTFLLTKFNTKNLWRLYPTRANGQPAFALYQAEQEKGSYRAFGIQVIKLQDSQFPRQIAEVTIFHGSSLVTSFGFPLHIHE